MTIDKPIRISPRSNVGPLLLIHSPAAWPPANGPSILVSFTLDPPSTWKNGEYAHDLSWFWIFASIFGGVLEGLGIFLIGHPPFWETHISVIFHPSFHPNKTSRQGPCVPWEFRPRPPRQRPEPAMPEKRPWTSGDAMGIVNWNNAILNTNMTQSYYIWWNDN